MVWQVVYYVVDCYFNVYVYMVWVLLGGEVLVQFVYEEVWVVFFVFSFVIEFSLLLFEWLYIYWDEVLVDVIDWQQVGLCFDGSEWIFDGLFGQVVWYGCYYIVYIIWLCECEGW